MIGVGGIKGIHKSYSYKMKKAFFLVSVQLTAQNISGHQLATLSQFKPNAAQGGAVPQQQLLQLQQLPYKQLQQIQIRQPQAAVSSSVAKPKSKKRTTPTPPKQ